MARRHPRPADPDACAAVAAGYDDNAGFRSTVVMSRHGFGRGEYRYFAIRCRTWWPPA